MNWNKKIIWGISLGELLALLTFYAFSAVAYYTAIQLSVPNERQYDTLFDLWRIFDGGGLQYSVFFGFTVLIWWLIFRLLRHQALHLRLLAHVITLPFFVIGSQQTYYYICDYYGLGHLQGNGQVWDIYIPALFYILQFGIFHAYAYYKENQRKLKLEGELRQAALKSELSALKAQLNPHFLYNVFNTISASVPPEQETTRQMIAELSDLFRYQLRASRQELVPLRDELEFVDKYLSLEKARFGNRLETKIDVASELLNEPVPPLILQPLVENSVKHGISTQIAGGNITIKVIKEANGRLRFTVADTGVGVKDKSNLLQGGIGLSNTRQRLLKMFQSDIEFTDTQPQGLTVSFAL
jgi:signal transduction histidine kinase